MSAKLPPIADALLRALVAADGAIPYRDPRVTISGLTGLRKRGLAMVAHTNGPWVLLTTDGRAMAKGTCPHPNATPSARVPAMTCPDCGAVFQVKEARP